MAPASKRNVTLPSTAVKVPTLSFRVTALRAPMRWPRPKTTSRKEEKTMSRVKVSVYLRAKSE